MKIAICSPIHSCAKPRFLQSVARMITRTLTARIQQPDGTPVPIDLETFVVSSSNIAFSRRKLAEMAVDWGADWLLWLDADHTFPPDTLLQLLAHNKPIIGANYRRRMEEVRFTAPVAPKPDGVEETPYLGFGVCLVAAKVFRAMSPPYFHDEMLPDGNVVGEDVYFCRKAREAGFAAFVDHRLSLAVTHTADVHLKMPAEFSISEGPKAQ